MWTTLFAVLDNMQAFVVSSPVFDPLTCSLYNLLLMLMLMMP